jgi:molecular chaperone HscB
MSNDVLPFVCLLFRPTSYDVSEKELDGHFRGLQAQLHPDKFTLRSETEQTFSYQHASTVNQAYQTLKDPIKRARYLLELNGMKLDDETDKITDPELLMEVRRSPASC